MKSVKFSAPEKAEAASLPDTRNSPVQPYYTLPGMSTPSSTPDSPNKRLLQIPSPIVTRRTRTKSTSEIAITNPEVKGKVRYFCRTKGHGFIVPENGSEDLFLHISDIEGEYVPQEGDEVTYRLCPIPPKREKYQATHVRIVNFTPEVHHRWDCKPDEDAHH